MSDSNKMEKPQSVSWEAIQKLQEKQAAGTPKQVVVNEVEDTMGLVMQIKFNYEQELQELLGEAQDKLGDKADKHILAIESHLESISGLLMSTLGEEDVDRLIEANVVKEEEE